MKLHPGKLSRSGGCCCSGDAHDHRAATLQPRRLQLRAQGEMTFGNISPYLYGPSPWIDSYVTPVDLSGVIHPRPTGRSSSSSTARSTGSHSTTSSGPLSGFACSRLSRGDDRLRRRDVGRGLDRDPARRCALGDEPAGLAHVESGAHNDAIMAGFLVVGIALAVKKAIPSGRCSSVRAAAAIKAPAA